MAAQARAQMAEAAQNQAAVLQRLPDMATVMPQIVRGQRRVELPQKRKCDWTTAAGGE